MLIKLQVNGTFVFLAARRPSSNTQPDVQSEHYVDPAIECYIYCVSGLLKLMQVTA